MRKSSSPGSSRPIRRDQKRPRLTVPLVAISSSNSDLCRELRHAGVDAVDNPDGLIVRPGAAHTATLATHHDHRLAMAFALLGLGASGIIVEDPDVVSKSWPDFWTMIESLR